MKITTDLTKDDYQKLIVEAQCDILKHISHKPIKMNIENNEIIGEMQCLGVKLTDGGRTIEGKIVPPHMKFAFRVIFDSDNICLAKNLNHLVEIIVEEKKIPEKLNLDTDELRGNETPRAIDYFRKEK